jgi:hypothetical protein
MIEGLVCGFAVNKIYYLMNEKLCCIDMDSNVNLKEIEEIILEETSDKTEELVDSAKVDVNDEENNIELDDNDNQLNQNENINEDEISSSSGFINTNIPEMYLSYIKIGSYFYHTNPKFSGGEILDVENNRIHSVLPGGRRGYVSVEKYLSILDKLMKLEVKHNIKLGQEFSSKKLSNFFFSSPLR